MRGDGSVSASGGWLGAFKVQICRPTSSMLASVSGPVRLRASALRFGAYLPAAWTRPCRSAASNRARGSVWLPTGALGLLPLALAYDPASNKRFGEKYELVSAPSLEALGEAARQVAQAQTPSLAVVVIQTILIAPLSVAGGAVGFADYLQFVWTMPPLTHQLIAAAVCVASTALLWRNIEEIGRLAVVMLWVVLITVGWVIVAGLFTFSPAQAFDFPPAGLHDFGGRVCG